MNRWRIRQLAVLVTVLFAAFAIAVHPARAASNPIVLENQQPGTTSWQFDNYNKAQNHEIEGYASLTSVNKGGQIQFMVSLSASAQYTMSIYRMGWYPTGTNPDGTSCAPSCGGRLMQQVGPLTGSPQAACPTDTSATDQNYGMIECHWTPSYTLTVPTTWTTGNYLVKLTRLDDGLENYMTFVVRDDSSTAPIVYSLDVNTWQAYNFWGGAGNNNLGISLYTRFNDVTFASVSGSRAYTVSFDRPYMDQGSQDGAGNFMVWDFPMIRWMESQGYNITYVTDADLESNPSALSGHSVLVNAGHDEYYSEQMRTNIQNAIASGMNMAFFSANNIYSRLTWQADYSGAPLRRIHDDKNALPGSTTYEFRVLTPPEPENAITGVMQNGVATSRPFLVYNASSWVFAGTGLVNYTGNGTTGVVTSGPGQNALPGLIGYEFDERAANDSSLSAYRSSEPSGIQQVGHSFVPASDTGVNSWSDATVYTAPSGATIFAAGTIQWSFAVDNGFNDGFCDCDHNVASSIGQKITANVLNRLSTPAIAPVVSLSPSSVAFGSQVVGNSSGSQSVTLTNSGTGPLSIGGIAVAGANAGDFGQTNTCPSGSATLAAGASCAISVTFLATATGGRSASLQVTDNAGNSPQSVALTGTGTAPASAVSLSPSSVAFGSQLVGNMSGSQSITLTNSGTGPLSISSIVFMGANAGDFGQANTCPVGSTLAVGASCVISVTFTPTAAGSRSASLQVTDNAAGSPQGVPVSGTGVAPAVSLSPSSVAFASQPVGNSSGSQSVTLTNSGTAPLSIGGIAVAGANAGDFGQANTCPVGSTLAAGASCAISVTFTPTAAGSRSGSLQVTDNAADSPESVGLTGTGTAPAPAVSLSPSSVAFTSQPVGNTSGAQSVTLTDSGTAPLSISSIAFTGANAGDFGQINTCPSGSATLAAGASCVISVTFTPTAAGSRSASLQVTDNAGNSPQGVPVSGTGLAPAVSLSPSSVAFASQLVGNTSAAQSVTLTNSGAAPLSIGGIAVAGANAGDFGQANTCPVGSTLAVGASCVISVTFTPTAAGSRSASLQVTDNAGNSPQSVALTGTGTAPAPAVSLSPSSVAFASQLVGNTSGAQSVTLTNSGTGPLSIGGIAVAGANAGDFGQTNTCPVGSTLAAGASCAISVTFTPTATGSRTASLQLTDNAAGSPQGVPVSGTGIAPAVSLSPSSVTFASQLVGNTSGAQSITLTNSGTAPLSISSIAVAGANASDFGQANTCPVGSTLAAGATCAISLTFTPTATGTRTASLQITDNATGSPQSIAVSGTGSTSKIAFDNNLGTLTQNATSPKPKLTTTTAASSGTRVFLFLVWSSPNKTLTSVSGGGLTWSVDAQVMGVGNNHTAIASASAPSGLAAGTAITATLSGGATVGDMAAASFAGITTASPVDKSATSTQAGVSGWTANLATTNANDLVLGASTINAATTNTPIAPNLTIHNFNQTPFASSLTSEYQITGTAGTKTINGTWANTSGATSNATAVVAYKSS